MVTPPINSFGTVPGVGADPASNPDEAIDDQPLTVGQLNAILSDFKAHVDRALARQEADLEERFGAGDLGGLGSVSGTLLPGTDAGDADHFSAVADSKPKEPVVKSTVEIPARLRLRMKSFEIDSKTSAQKLIVAAIEEYLVKRKR